MIDRYQREVIWEINGMEYPRLNCWGFARHARAEMFGLPMLPATPNVNAHDKRDLTRSCLSIVSDYLVEILEPVAGCFATAWRNALCIHVALVVESEGRLSILEIDKGSSVRVMRIQDWAARFQKVKYYNDR